MNNNSIQSQVALAIPQCKTLKAIPPCANTVAPNHVETHDKIAVLSTEPLPLESTVPFE